MRRDKNQFADALATLASMVQIIAREKIHPIDIKIQNHQAHCCTLEESPNGEPWYNDIKRFIQHRDYPQEASETNKKTLRRLVVNLYLDGKILYKRSFDGTLLKCLDEKEIGQTLKEVQKGICATYANGHTMARQMQRFGYFLLTIERDCMTYVRKCHNARFMVIK